MFLYQIEIQKGDVDSQLTTFIEEQGVRDASLIFLKELIAGVREKLEDLDACFTPYLKRWTKERLPRIDLSILRLAVYEMKYVPEVPHNVAISEAVLLSKKYSSEESRAYINAVLGKVSKDLVPSDSRVGKDDSTHADADQDAGVGLAEAPIKTDKDTGAI